MSATSVRTRLSIDVPPTQSAAAPKQELTLTFDELALIYKSLQAVKTLGALPSEDELLDDTIQLVDQAAERRDSVARTDATFQAKTGPSASTAASVSLWSRIAVQLSPRSRLSQI